MRIQLLFAFLLEIFLIKCCKDVDLRMAISYRLIKSNSKSIMPAITRRRLANVAKCKDFAESKQALAFNFEKAPVDPWIENCIVLRCPEIGNITGLANATGVDYYSSYPNGTSAGNATLQCIDSVGLFALIREKQNFTNAREGCQKLHGFLADPISDVRTRGLAAINGNLSWVGLSNEGKGQPWKNELGDVLSCSDYRAWDTGEPSHTRGCVGLYWEDQKSDPVWKVISCKTQLQQYICEFPRSFTTNSTTNTTTNSTQQ